MGLLLTLRLNRFMNPAHAPLTLADLPRIGLAKVSLVLGSDSSALRLLELGFTPGTEVVFVRRAPFGGPFVVQLRGYQLCLRTREARLVQVVTTGEPG
jgi:ferrous iron transport protein A